jgi:hypothetical protein
VFSSWRQNCPSVPLSTKHAGIGSLSFALLPCEGTKSIPLLPLHLLPGEVAAIRSSSDAGPLILDFQPKE